MWVLSWQQQSKSWIWYAFLKSIILSRFPASTVDHVCIYMIKQGHYKKLLSTWFRVSGGIVFLPNTLQLFKGHFSLFLISQNDSRCGFFFDDRLSVYLAQQYYTESIKQLTPRAQAIDHFVHPRILHSSRGFAQVCSARVFPSIILRLESGVLWRRARVMIQGDKDLWQMTARRDCGAAVRQPWRSVSRLVWDEMWVSHLSCLRCTKK